MKSCPWLSKINALMLSVQYFYAEGSGLLDWTSFSQTKVYDPKYSWKMLPAGV